MKVKALWYGGCNYAAPDGERDIETFDTIKAAKQSFYSRADHDPYYPCVDQDATEMHLYLGGAYTEDGPDRILTLGPRGGVRVARN